MDCTVLYPALTFTWKVLPLTKFFKALRLRVQISSGADLNQHPHMEAICTHKKTAQSVVQIPCTDVDLIRTGNPQRESSFGDTERMVTGNWSKLD
jgi:hypothetical protein